MKKLKCLHLGNGTVYLKSTKNEEWINVDMVGKLAVNNPKMVEHNGTTVDKYYKYPFRMNKGNNVTDIHVDARDLSRFKDESFDKILNVNLIDHFKKEEFIKALQEWKRVLKKGGELIIDVDDRGKQAQMLVNSKTQEETDWALRLIYCDHADIGRSHFWGYTQNYLKHILEEAGFKYVWTSNSYILHDVYPNFQICVKK